MECKFHFASFSFLPPTSKTIAFQAFYAEHTRSRKQKPAANFLICNDEAQKPQSKKETIPLPIHPNSILSWQSNKCHHKRDAKWLQLCKIIIDLLSLVSPALAQCTLDGRTEWC